MSTPWLPVASLEGEALKRLRREAIFTCCKWDVQIGDTCSLSPFPIVLRPEAWQEIRRLAEALAEETLAAETELRTRPELHRHLGLPKAVLRELSRAARTDAPEPGVRVIRFDFHYTTEGWRISEANTDVPGGYNEASGLAGLLAQHYPGLGSTGDPARALAEAIGARVRDGAPVALVHATAFTDDRQVMTYLARELEHWGTNSAHLLSPDHLVWREGEAHIHTDWYRGPAGFVFRFFPAEWLPKLRRRCGWEHFFHRARTPLGNPGTALLTQSKRFPLVWEALRSALPTWQRLLPETLPVHETDWQRETSHWVLKPALGRVGEMIGLRGVSDARKWQAIFKAVRQQPEAWAAQRQFEAVPMVTAQGTCFPCIGVYTLNGRAAGAYGRVAPVPLIDQYAQDAAVLVASESATVATAPGSSSHPTGQRREDSA